jgi:flagellar biosynthesis protein FlhF
MEKSRAAKNRLADEMMTKAEETPTLVAEPAEGQQTPSEILNHIKNEIASLRKEFEVSLTQSLFGEPRGAALAIARRLVERLLPEEIAVDAVRKLALQGIDWRDPISTWKNITDLIARMLPSGEPLKIIEGAATVIFLVGPTGSGKTSAAARLAFQFGVEKNFPVTLMTTDTFRADAKEQLRSLAGVIGCSFAAFSSPEELAVALKSYKQGLIVVDTTGASNDKEISAVVPFVGAANPHEVHLVIPADMPAADICRYVKGYPDLGVDRLLITKLDQTCCRGGVIAACTSLGIKLSYQCASREMPGLFDLFQPVHFVSTFMKDADPALAQNPDTLEVVGW